MAEGSNLDQDWRADSRVREARSLFDALAQGSGWKPGHAWFNVRFALEQNVAARAGLLPFEPVALAGYVEHYWRQPAMRQQVLGELERIMRSCEKAGT